MFGCRFGRNRANFPKLTGVGNLESRAFDPVRWKPNYPNPAFLLMDDEDAFWAAKQVMAFRDGEIRAMVETGQFTDPGASDWIARCLIERRDKIGSAWLTRVLPLHRFRVEDRKLAFSDLAAEFGPQPAASYQVRWAVFDNSRNTYKPLQVQGTEVAGVLQAAPEAEYVSACIEPRSEQRLPEVRGCLPSAERELLGSCWRGPPFNPSVLRRRSIAAILSWMWQQVPG